MRLVAHSCSLDGGPGTFRIVLTVDIEGVPHQVEYTEQGERADRFATEVHRQARLGLERDNRAIKEAHAAAVDEKTALAALLDDTHAQLEEERAKNKDKP